jgi:hypothetical protein
LEHIMVAFFLAFFFIALTIFSGSAHPIIVSLCRSKSICRLCIPAKQQVHQIVRWCSWCHLEGKPSQIIYLPLMPLSAFLIFCAHPLQSTRTCIVVTRGVCI